MIFSVFGGRYTTQTLNLVLLFDKTQEMYSKEVNISAESNLGPHSCLHSKATPPPDLPFLSIHFNMYPVGVNCFLIAWFTVRMSFKIRHDNKVMDKNSFLFLSECFDKFMDYTRTYNK